MTFFFKHKIRYFELRSKLDIYYASIVHEFCFPLFVFAARQDAEEEESPYCEGSPTSTKSLSPRRLQRRAVSTYTLFHTLAHRGKRGSRTVHLLKEAAICTPVSPNRRGAAWLTAVAKAAVCSVCLACAIQWCVAKPRQGSSEPPIDAGGGLDSYHSLACLHFQPK